MGCKPRQRPEPDVDPCRGCGERCGSQLEFVELNGGRPWQLCSGCDPDLAPPHEPGDGEEPEQ